MNCLVRWSNMEPQWLVAHLIRLISLVIAFTKML